MSAVRKQLKIADFFTRSNAAKSPLKLSTVTNASMLGAKDESGSDVAKIDSEPPVKRSKLGENCDKENLCENTSTLPSSESGSVLANRASDSEAKDDLANSTLTKMIDASSVVTPSKATTSCSFADGIRNSLREAGWRRVLKAELQKPYMNEVFQFLDAQYKKGATIFPPRGLIFNAFNLTPFRDVRVVLIGQDPYHNYGQAHGLCFSVPHGVPPPPSLKNIYKELATEYPDFREPNHGCLTEWAAQGVFMLNATLTVEAHKANSHSDVGWQRFTDEVIRILSKDATEPCVFLLWGGFAHKKTALINAKRHRIIKTAHPSPLSYARFRGCACFSATNRALVELGRKPINWNCL